MYGHGTIRYDDDLRYRTAENRMDKPLLSVCTMETIVLLVRSEEGGVRSEELGVSENGVLSCK